jgi:hypothetical protein
VLDYVEVVNTLLDMPSETWRDIAHAIERACRGG